MSVKGANARKIFLFEKESPTYENSLGVQKEDTLSKKGIKFKKTPAITAKFKKAKWLEAKKAWNLKC